MYATYLSLAFFAAVAFTAPVAQNTISGRDVIVNGRPLLPGTGCVMKGQQVPVAQCPTEPDHGLICIVDDNLVTGDACAGRPDVIDLGPPGCLKSRTFPIVDFSFPS